MKVLTKNRLRIIIVLATVFLLTTSALASSVASYEANWYTVDGGGGNSSGGAYTLSGTIGQADAGMLSGGTYILAGGFWAGAGPLGSQLYLPVITR